MGSIEPPSNFADAIRATVQKLAEICKSFRFPSAETKVFYKEALNEALTGKSTKKLNDLIAMLSKNKDAKTVEIL